MPLGWRGGEVVAAVSDGGHAVSIPSSLVSLSGVAVVAGDRNVFYLLIRQAAVLVHKSEGSLGERIDTQESP